MSQETRKLRITGGTLEGYLVDETEPPEPPEPPIEPPIEPPVEPPVEPPIEPPPVEPPPEGERRHPIVSVHHLFDFASGELQDGDWLCRQPAGVVANIVEQKSDSGRCTLRIAEAAGRQGNDCLEVHCPNASAGLPSVSFGRYLANGGSYVRVSGERKWMAEGHRANRIAFWVRFTPGLYEHETIRPFNQHVQTIHLGTFHARPEGDAKESNNWHYYHQEVFALHVAQGGWIYVEFKPWPSYQRSTSGCPDYNPTSSGGLNYWECLTSFYLEMVPYFADPGIPWPFSMWIDGLAVLDVDESAGPDTDWQESGLGGWCSYTDRNVECRWERHRGPGDAAIDTGSARVLQGLGRHVIP